MALVLNLFGRKKGSPPVDWTDFFPDHKPERRARGQTWQEAKLRVTAWSQVARGPVRGSPRKGRA